MHHSNLMSSDEYSGRLDRRRFLKGALGAMALGLGGTPAGAAAGGRSLVLVWLSGGLSHIDTFDMKPDAPREIRGEFRSIPTSVPGVRISEHLPRTARLMDRLTLVRSMTSGESHHQRAMARLEAGALERGAACVTLDSGWLRYDTHAGSFAALKDDLLPRFDREFSTLILGLEETGLLASTLVVTMGEFGRSPRINKQGGRDHHSRAWSALLAGAGVPRSLVLGATDRHGAEVTEDPVTPEDLLASVDAVLGRPPDPARGGRVIRQIVEA
jgi:uncharacterized protein (DUF1501 family)